MISFQSKWTLLALGFVIISFFFVEKFEMLAIFSGFIVSSAFVFSSGWVIRKFWDGDSALFTKVFFFAMAIRFLLIILVMGILLGITKIDEIYFTVSLIISYLYHSVTEMIFVNQKLLKKSSQKK